MTNTTRKMSEGARKMTESPRNTVQFVLRQLLLPLLALILAAVLTGCVRIDVDVTIRKDGKADITMIYAAQDTLASMGGTDGLSMSEESLEELRSQGWEVKDYSAGGYTGHILSRTGADPNDMKLGEGSNLNVKKEGSTYIVDLDLFPKEEDRKSFSDAAGLLQSGGGSFKVRLTLPVKPLKHNATTVTNEGKTLEWDVLNMNIQEPIHVEFKVPNYTVLILIGVLAAAGILFFLLNKKKTGGDAPAAEGQGQSGTAATPENIAGTNTPARKVCRNCGAELAENNNFCPICGKKYEG